MATEKYTIPAIARETVEAELRKVQRKAEKYGKTLAWSFGPENAKKRTIWKQQQWTQNTVKTEKIGEELVEAIDITIESEIVKIDGYNVIAKIEHLESANIVTRIDREAEIDSKWTKADAHCEHCRTTRPRTVTFIVRKDGTDKQIGSSCLKDYCGIDPQMTAIRNQLTETLTLYDMEAYDFDRAAEHSYRAYEAYKSLALAVDVYKAQGYRKADEPDSNKDKLREAMMDVAQPTGKALEAAQAITEFLAARGYEDLDNILWNVKTITEAGYCKLSNAGILAYAPAAYEHQIEEEERQRARKEQTAKEAAASSYIGELGQRIMIDIAECKLLTSWDGDYGTTYLYKMLDTEGNVFIWYASKRFGEQVKGRCIESAHDERGYFYETNFQEFVTGKIKATIKDHTEREGVKQTVITRCKTA
jgi:hypothetical protein